MKILLDTCTFLWIIKGASELSDNVKILFRDPDNEVYLSSISMWEILVKHRLGRLPLPEEPARFIIDQRQKHQIETLPLHEESTLQLLQLPEYHRDPFDRMLIAQAISHSLIILTPDHAIKQYPVNTLW